MPRIGRPTKGEVAQRQHERMQAMAKDPQQEGAPGIGDWSATLTGVGLSWLAFAFRMDVNAVKKRLAKLPSIGKKAGHPVWDLSQAAAYLVKSKLDLAEFIKGAKSGDLPVIMQDQWWAAKLKRQQWEMRAGNLWHTDDVLEVFGTTFLMIKDTMQLWTENLSDTAPGLTEQQRKALTQMVDGLQNDLHKNLIEIPTSKRTRSQLSEIDEVLDVVVADEDLVG